MEKNDIIFTGKQTEITLPDSSVVTIRESNGEDEGILSQIGNMRDGSNLHAFLASIITQPENTTPAIVATWPLNNIFYLMYRQRIFNLGKDFTFKEECQNCGDGVEHEFEQDAMEFDNFPPYPQGLKRVIEFQTSSAKTLRYNIVTGLVQKIQLDTPQDALNKNIPMLERELEIYKDGNWTPVKTFYNFSSKEMLEIRKNIKTNDPQFNPIVKFSCPKCKAPGRTPLLNISSFYWPEETI